MSDWGETKQDWNQHFGMEDQEEWEQGDSKNYSDVDIDDTDNDYQDDLEQQLWNEGTFGAGRIAGDNLTYGNPISPCYIAMNTNLWQHDDVQNTRWVQHCEAMAPNRQAHGNLFEERVAAYISIEMYNWIVENFDSSQTEGITPLDLYRDWYYSQELGMTDPYDVDFGSERCVVSQSRHCYSHFSQLEGGFPEIAQAVLEEMRHRYGIGISVKTVKGFYNRQSPVNMGDLRRISQEFSDGAEDFSLIIGVWNYQEGVDIHGITHVCRTIRNVYCLSNLGPDERQLFFNDVTHDEIRNFVENWVPNGYTAETKQQFMQARSQLETSISISPKMANLAKRRAGRCQCAISNGLFNDLRNEDFFEVWEMDDYPHLWRPMYKIEDQPDEEGEEWGGDEDAEEQHQLDSQFSDNEFDDDDDGIDADIYEDDDDDDDEDSSDSGDSSYSNYTQDTSEDSDDYEYSSDDSLGGGRRKRRKKRKTRKQKAKRNKKTRKHKNKKMKKQKKKQNKKTRKRKSKKIKKRKKTKVKRL